MILAGQRRGRADVVESRIERRGEKIGQARGEWGFTVRTPVRGRGRCCREEASENNREKTLEEAQHLRLI